MPGTLQPEGRRCCGTAQRPSSRKTDSRKTVSYSSVKSIEVILSRLKPAVARNVTAFGSVLKAGDRMPLVAAMLGLLPPPNSLSELCSVVPAMPGAS